MDVPPVFGKCQKSATTRSWAPGAKWRDDGDHLTPWPLMHNIGIAKQRRRSHYLRIALILKLWVTFVELSGLAKSTAVSANCGAYPIPPACL